MGPCEIVQAPVLETAYNNSIQAFLKPGTNYSKVEIELIKISEGATSTLNVGDYIDMNIENKFTVTAKDGTQREFTIYKPAKFSCKQGEVIERTYKGVTHNMSIGEWLCLGQNMEWNIDPVTHDSIGFYRYTINASPIIGDALMSTTFFSGSAKDNDDYIIFRSNGTYVVSAGKDGISSVIDGTLPYRDYLIPRGKGYWTIVKAKCFDATNGYGHNGQEGMWGIQLTDSQTDKQYTINYWYIHKTADWTRPQIWPLNVNSPRVQYTFNFTTENWRDWVLEEDLTY
jgi:hypothetical protein